MSHADEAALIRRSAPGTRLLFTVRSLSQLVFRSSLVMTSWSKPAAGSIKRQRANPPIGGTRYLLHLRKHQPHGARHVPLPADQNLGSVDHGGKFAGSEDEQPSLTLEYFIPLLLRALKSNSSGKGHRLYSTPPTGLSVENCIEGKSLRDLRGTRLATFFGLCA